MKPKPPLGIMPKWLWEEVRLKELKEAIERYTNEYLPINVKWVNEYNELIQTIQRREKNE